MLTLIRNMLSSRLYIVSMLKLERRKLLESERPVRRMFPAFLGVSRSEPKHNFGLMIPEYSIRLSLQLRGNPLLS